ncbi:hypothetical protein AB4561_17965, partial [Vibrio sp. 10N.222.55.A3]|uniref:hypothetical protein n=1 Tax=Vibrio sp. 10N.222.55.A3 TaxID=3229647 RepID=UPI00354E4F4E
QTTLRNYDFLLLEDEKHSPSLLPFFAAILETSCFVQKSGKLWRHSHVWHSTYGKESTPW